MKARCIGRNPPRTLNPSMVVTSRRLQVTASITPSASKVCLQGPPPFQLVEEQRTVRWPAPSTPSRSRPSSGHCDLLRLQRYRRYPNLAGPSLIAYHFKVPFHPAVKIRLLRKISNLQESDSGRWFDHPESRRLLLQGIVNEVLGTIFG